MLGRHFLQETFCIPKNNGLGNSDGRDQFRGRFSRRGLPLPVNAGHGFLRTSPAGSHRTVHRISERRSPQGRENAADLPELQKLTNEFAAIGNNLNQIAKYFNTGGLQSKAMREEINSCIAQIMQMRKAVMEMAGDFHGNPQAPVE